MGLDHEQVTAIIASQLAVFRYADVEAFKLFLVPPERQEREWDYGPTGTVYECWVVARLSERLGIGYSQFGHGPSFPWGLIDLQDPTYVGPDYCWYSRLEDAFIESGEWKGGVPDGYEVD